MQGVLYIAQPPDSGTLKIGQTTRDPRTRVRELSGQTLHRFELLRVFESAHPVDAEELVFELLAKKGYPRIGGDRKEHVGAPLPLVIEMCERAILLTNKKKLAPPPATPLAPVVHWKWPAQAVWGHLQKMPVQLGGEPSTLKEVVERAVFCRFARARLKRWGLELVHFQPKSVDFLIEWETSRAVLKWLTVSTGKPVVPGDLAPRLRLTRT